MSGPKPLEKTKEKRSRRQHLFIFRAESLYIDHIPPRGGRRRSRVRDPGRKLVHLHRNVPRTNQLMKAPATNAKCRARGSEQPAQAILKTNIKKQLKKNEIRSSRLDLQYTYLRFFAFPLAFLSTCVFAGPSFQSMLTENGILCAPPPP